VPVATLATPVAEPDRAGGDLPALVVAAGPAAAFVWDEVFAGEIRNPHTRAAYERAARRFLGWCLEREFDLQRVRPGDVGRYLDEMQASAPTKKQHLAAVRRFFDRLVTRHVVALNPAASVRGERYQVVEGKTPEIMPHQARQLLDSIDTTTVVGLRDRALVGVLIYTAARVGAVAKLRIRDLQHDGSQWLLRFESEKGGKSREIPVRHDLEGYLLAYLDAADLRAAPKDAPLFRTTVRKTKALTDRQMTAIDACRMVKRRLEDAKLPTRLSPHSFRVTTATNLLDQGVPLDEVQGLLGHADPRTTRLYDRRQKKVTRNIVERISI
jgi:site-specific recombinase XerD